MPPTRRSRTSGGPATPGSQSTLSFGSANKVTKPTAKSATKAKSVLSASLSSTNTPAVAQDIDLSTGHVTSETAIAEQARSELKKERSEEERRALKVTDAQIRKYWRAREAERRTGRVHQEDLSVEEKILRLFDVSSQYGPCIGIARMKRWNRANKLELAPPIEVLAVLLKEEEKGNDKIERAHIDELMSSTNTIGDDV